MSVLIKGMKMPTRCIDCPFMVSRDNDDCILQSAEANENFENWEQMKAGCPLIELPPHGRLIDGDIAEVIVTDAKDEVGGFLDGILYAAGWIANQPTIVEADDTVKTPLFDIVEEHDHCHVQVLRNSITGEVSVGWWEEKE